MVASVKFCLKMSKLFLSQILCVVVVVSGKLNQPNVTRSIRESPWQQSVQDGKNGNYGSGGMTTSHVQTYLGSVSFEKPQEDQGSGSIQGYGSGWHTNGGNNGGSGWNSYGMQMGDKNKYEEGMSGGWNEGAGKDNHAGQWSSSDYNSRDSAAGGQLFGGSYGGQEIGGGVILGISVEGGSENSHNNNGQVFGSGDQHSQSYSAGGANGNGAGSYNGYGGSTGSGGHSLASNLVDFSGFGNGGSEHHGSAGGQSGAIAFFLHPPPLVHETTKPEVVHKEIKIPVQHPVKHPLVIPFPYKEIEPVLIQIPVPVPVEKTVEVPVVKEIPFPVEKLVPVKVFKKVAVPVSKPYPVPVPVYKTKYIYHVKKISYGNEKKQYWD